MRFYSSILLLIVFAFLFQNCGKPLKIEEKVLPSDIMSYSFSIIGSQKTNLEVLEGDNVELYVDIQEGQFPVQIEWRRQEEDVILSTARHFHFTTKLQDSGIYQAKIFDQDSETRLTFQLLVLNKNLESLPLVSPQTVTQFSKKEGESLSLSLTVSGSPTPQLQWYRGLPTTSGQALTGQNLNTLNLSNLTLDQAGDYYLQATNKLGTALSQKFSLEINVPPSYKGTHVYLGGTGKLLKFYFDASTETISPSQTYNFSGGSIGSIAHLEDRMVAVSRTGNAVELYSLANNFSLSSIKSLNFLANSVHVNFSKEGNKYLLFGSSYTNAQASYFSADDKQLSGYTERKKITYSTGLKTHSSSYSASLKFLFVSNLGENKVKIYRVTASDLISLGNISVVSPRNVFYDETYQLLYVVTEAASQNGFIKIYEVNPMGNNNVSVVEKGSYSIGLKGSDLKINHSKNFISAMVREPGAEKLVILPLTATGQIDSTRTPFVYSIIIPAPRSLSISDNGMYFFVTTSELNSSSHLVVYKATYNSSMQITGMQKVTQANTVSDYYYCNYSLDDNL